MKKKNIYNGEKKDNLVFKYIYIYMSLVKVYMWYVVSYQCGYLTTDIIPKKMRDLGWTNLQYMISCMKFYNLAL